MSGDPDEFDEDDFEFDDDEDDLEWQEGMLHRRRLNSWTARSRNEEPPHTFVHGTQHGLLKLAPSYPLGMLHCAVFINDRFIGTSRHPLEAASDIGNGKFDKELGFAAAGLVPSDLERWGGRE